MFLLTEMKYRKVHPRILEAKFKYGNVLLGLAMLHDDEKKSDKSKDENEKISIEDRIRAVTRAVSPVLLPMIDQLSGLSEDELESMGMVGD